MRKASKKSSSALRAHLQFESSLTAWERLSLSLNSRYAIWKQPGASVEESGDEETPRTTLLGQPPHWLLRQPTVGPATTSLPAGVVTGDVHDLSASMSAAPRAIAKPVAAESRRPLFYCQGRVRLIYCVIHVSVALFLEWDMVAMQCFLRPLAACSLVLSSLPAPSRLWHRSTLATSLTTPLHHGAALGPHLLPLM